MVKERVILCFSNLANARPTKTIESKANTFVVTKVMLAA
jgi:hypothetical protein